MALPGHHPARLRDPRPHRLLRGRRRRDARARDRLVPPRRGPDPPLQLARPEEGRPPVLRRAAEDDRRGVVRRRGRRGGRRGRGRRPRRAGRREPARYLPDGGTPGGTESTGQALKVRSEQVTAALAADEWPALDPAVESFGDFGRDVIAPEWAKDGCLGGDLADEKDAIRNTEHCSYGNQGAGADKTAVIFGDSLAISYAPMLRASLGEEWKVRVLTMARCPASTVTSIDTDGSEYTECTDFRNWALGEMNATKPALVLMSEAVDNSYLSSKAVGGAADREWQDGALTTMNSLKTAAANVIVLSRPPAATALVECKTPTSSPNDCRAEVSPSFISHARTMAAAAEEVGAPVQFINTQGWFCSQGNCPAFVNGIPVRGDTSHLTARQSQDLAPIMSDVLAPLGIVAPAAG
ncbi:SGNH hydrolase domain-containing protein [Clavibacter zhangzhiyongii]|uniref:SGNH hydrolase domain-containing protein n=1 Tax=Clavibacter zhangzhiyongii TaxID=2768071 RepID=UPI0039E04894